MKHLSTLALPAALALVLAIAMPPANADPVQDIEWSGSGFLSLAAGKILKGTHEEATDLGYDCPCFISDYGQRGVYEGGGWQFGPDSRLGLQGNASVAAGRYSVTAQVVARGSMRGKADLEWLYATAELGSDWTLQVGRKRLPLFMSSEVQDVGYALPWVHLPPQLYGWEIVNYDGASLTYRGAVGPWLATVNLLAGQETAHDAGYWHIYHGKNSRTDSRWTDISGVEAKLSRGPFDARLVMIQSYEQSRVLSAGETDYSPKAWQRIHGLSLAMDDGRWMARTELLYINRQEDYGGDHAQLYAAGRRFGPLLAMLSYSNYRQSVNFGAGPAESHSTRSAVLRYELGQSSALKLQFDQWHDKAAPGYGAPHGDVQLLSVAYDRVF